MFKPKHGEIQRFGIPDGTLYRREVASYVVDKFFGFSLVPPTVYKVIDNNEGSLQRFIPDACTGGGVPSNELQQLDEEFTKMLLLDMIIWNSDRHGNNFLVKDKRLIAIDHGFAFAGPRSNLRYVLAKDIWDCCVVEFDSNNEDEIVVPKDVAQKIIDMSSPSSSKLNSLRAVLGELIEEVAVDACINRIRFLAKALNDNNGVLPVDFKLIYNPII